MAEAKDPSETKQELSLVCQSSIIFCDPGDDVVLSCRVEPAVSAASMEIQWWSKEDLVCHYKDGRVKVSSEGRASLSLKDLHNGHVSLILRDVRRSQKGHYICEVIHECQTLQENVFLHISSEDLSLVIPSGIVSADPGEDVILPVHLSPETSAVSMKIRWFRESELIYQYMNGQEKTNDDCKHRLSLAIQELETGNLSLTLRKFEPSDSGKYTCKVFHDGCLQTGIVHLQEIEKCDGSRLRRVNSVLRKIKKDILIQKIELLTGTLKLVEETLNQNESGNYALVPTSKRTNSMEGIPPTLEKEKLSNVYGKNIFHMTSKGSPKTSITHCDQNTEEGNTATEQELSQNLLSKIESIIGHRKSGTHSQENPGAILQTTQEWSKKTSQSVDTAHTPERPEDTNSKERTQRGKKRVSLFKGKLKGKDSK